MKKKPKKPHKPCLKLGNVYKITFDDHFFAQRVGIDDPTAFSPVSLTITGRLVTDTPTHYNLESCVHGDEVHDIYGVMKSCIRSVKDFGPW